MRRFLPKRHSAVQAAGVALIGVGVWDVFSLGVAVIVVGVLVLLAGVADEVG